ncbi:MAG: PTS lactose transporter subunit IIB, partial [Lactococcus sp.]|nr:PTS lactose transporter subunit IIB [Lactococcus sp.]
DVGSASPDLADVFFVGGALADSTMHLGRVIVLNSIIDMDELREKVTAVVKEAGLM